MFGCANTSAMATAAAAAEAGGGCSLWHTPGAAGRQAGRLAGRLCEHRCKLFDGDLE